MAERIMFWAIPGYFLLMAIELSVAWWRGRRVYRVNDAINSIGLGMLSQIVGVFTKVATVGLYAWTHAHAALFELPVDSPWVWFGALLLYDFCYYWLHRCGHEVGVLWAAHVVHHQSERYNLSTALRQTSSGALLGWLFYLPMAVLGVPPEVFAVVAAIDLLYQYWIHTELVGRLGWFDRVFASPSNHRVHHAVNDRYLDRNYGGILILWDRMFGTFIEEDPAEPPKFGTRAPLRSWNPLWANLEVYVALAKDAWHARRWRDKLRVWIAPPGWRPADVAERFPKPPFDFDRVEFDPPLSRAATGYGVLQFVVMLGLGTLFLQNVPQLSIVQVLGNSGFLILGLIALGGLYERRSWALPVEGLRLALLAIWPMLTADWPGHAWLAMHLREVFVAFALLSALGLVWAWRQPAAPVAASMP
jgi:sterol desaturase/sphingolipid hydroxylase (fatty acid hydroxylase superfamily)